MTPNSSNDSELSQEERIQLALDAYRQEPGLSLYKAHEIFRVPYSTLKARNKGRQSAQAYQQSQQRLSVQEEDALVKCILQTAAWGWPITIGYLEGLAKSMLQKKQDLDPLGHNWYKNFLQRHPEVKLKLARCHDQSRKDAAEYQELEKWFSLYQETIIKHGILHEDQYNMDEKGFMKGVGDSCKVLLPVQEEKAWSIQPGDRDWVSTIAAIGMSGYSVPPFVIFQGKQIQHSWIRDSIDTRTVIHVSPAGWTDRKIALCWLEHFNSYTKPRTIGEYRLLILDGHDSHVSLDFIQACNDSKIIPLCLPPHATHILQPLDVGIFAPVAKAYKKQIREHSLFGAERITNDQFLIQRQKKSRKQRTKKHFGEARVLTLEDALRQIKEREDKEREEMNAKERAAALRGKGVFAKLVWKELAMSFDVFV